MHLLIAIATLCQVSLGEASEKAQLKCQQEYLHCLDNTNREWSAQTLKHCVLQRKIK